VYETNFEYASTRTESMLKSALTLNANRTLKQGIHINYYILPMFHTHKVY